MAQGGSGDRHLSTEASDLQVERSTLWELLDRFPAQLRLDDLSARVTRFEVDPGRGSSGRVEEAIHELVGFGLVFRSAALVIPTPAALHFDLLIAGY